MSNLTKELQEMRDKYVTYGLGNGNKSIAVKAENATITTEDGQELIDFAGAIGVQNVGHRHPKVVKAVVDQVQNHMIHPGFSVVMYESYIRLAKKLAEITPGDFDKKVILFNTGAEAIENAVKIARRHTKRNGIVAFEGGYHGRTNLTMAMTSKADPYKIGYGPFASDIYMAPFPYMYRKPDQFTDEEYIDYVIAKFDDFFTITVTPDDISCVVMEPVQGEGGFIIPPKRFVQHVHAFCKEHGILFIADEIQTGFCRTGKTFALEHFDVVADMMTISKSLAAGFPLSGVIGRTDVMNKAKPGELGGTFVGNPVACAAALAVTEIIEEENLNEKAEKLGKTIEEHLLKLQKKYDYIGDVRRLGAMVGMEIIDPKTKKPNAEKTEAILEKANENGLLLITAGVYENVVRFLTPLTIHDDELSKGLAILEKSIDQLG